MIDNGHKVFNHAESRFSVKKYFTQLIVLGGLVLLLTGFSQAQDLQNRLRADVPFNFYAGSTSLPAGVYYFDIDPINHTAVVEQNSTGHAVFVTGMPADPSQNGEVLLTFRLVGGEYRLAELQGDSVGLGLAVPKTMPSVASTESNTAAGMH